MNKYVLSLFLLLIFSSVMGQRGPVKKTKVTLVSSDKTEFIKGPKGKNIAKVRNGVFSQDYSILRSDSALFYPDQNAFDAFGHVNINQGDTLNIFADKLNYNGNTKIAILTNNVKMVDKDATLTTNYLTYNTATRIGTYTGGGKLVNADNTLTSKNGYYFAYSRDAYFRYNVVTNTADAIIKTDTMRYNSGTRITYFYGPSNIYGKKDKDTLYTENGTYNTRTEQALFGKKNQYTQGSKSLKGDSLFYDRLKGYGRATRNVIFNDNEQKIIIKGHKGEYFKADERAQITINPYMVFITEEKDTTKTSTASNPNPIKNTAIKVLPDSAKSKASPPKNAIPANSKSTPINLVNKPVVNKAPEKVKQDSLFMVADTLETQIITVKELKDMQLQRWLASNRDTSIKIKPHIEYKKPLKFLALNPPKMPEDTSFYHRDIFGKPKPRVVIQKKAVPVKPAPTLAATDSLKIKQKADSVKLKQTQGLSDTSRIRIVSGFHKAKLFKSDLQAVADSMFYSSSDSTIRNYKNPMIWTQGSQLSGDTIHLQMKNKKLDNIDLFPSGFIVNIEKQDSIHFNQLKGKKIHGAFKDNKLSLLLVTGNAETIYFNRDSVTNEATDMERSISGSFRVNFTSGKLTNMAFLQSPEHRMLPLKDVKEEDRILKGFIWKPKDRPVSKEAILPPLLKSVNAKPSKAAPAKKPIIKAVPKKAATVTPASTLPKINKDTVTKEGAIVKQQVFTKKDTTVKRVNNL